MARGDHLVHGDRTFGCLLISSTQGHSGKTIVAVGLCKLLTQRGLLIQPFKKGPDYIDPSWLTIAAGRSCRNLDLFLVPKEKLIQTFEQACEKADLAIVEGAMGLYDGLDAQGTTAEIARLLKIPVVLLVNTSRMTSSIAAMVMGYQHFQPETNIAGVLLNYVSGSRHESKLRNAVEKYCKIPVVGSIPRDANLYIAERHLGLIPSRESNDADQSVKRLGEKLKSYFDVEQILSISKRFRMPSPSPIPVKEKERKEGTQVKIGVIFDQVFNFYYPENFEGLRQWGADLVFINSLQDRLPQIDGLYVGGGFPEFFLEKLEKNKELRQDLWKAIDQGLPVYAECAGLMYLSQKIHWQGRSYEMVGAIPAEVQVSEKPEGHGYVMAEVMNENPLFPIGLTIRGHEFHHSKVSIKKGVKFAYQVRRGHGIDGQKDGVLYKNIFAAYTHLHALGTPSWAEAFVSLAAKEGKFRR
ncbi:MAG: cobyrinic acid a,c-diamide synthase [Deltaproteobacteria bacterium CG03_land_8_20_14_0_80_45_14]|nr:MAG: cobyrinic acid a,c-diamide synthase [Deltaproteobacteria bacterium CG03_land_8_20_14_0_80_45_14]